MRNHVIVSPFFLDEYIPELQALAKPDWEINIPALPDGDRQTRMSAIHRPLADFVTKALHNGERPVSLAGDCCATIGVLAGLQRAGINPTLIWFDAHGDFNTWETTPSGFLGGMPLAMIVGRGEQTMSRAVGLTAFPEHQIILTDARDLDPGEDEAIQASAMIHLPDPMNLLEYPLPAGSFYIHFDVDIVRLEDVPAVSYPAPGGPSADELQDVFHYLAQTGQIVAISMTSWTPTLDHDGQSRAMCLKLLQTLIKTD